jgi:hypothetical protein
MTIGSQRGELGPLRPWMGTGTLRWHWRHARTRAMMRLSSRRTAARTTLCLVLALGVCLAQLGALVHAVSHLHESLRIGTPSAATIVSNPVSADAHEFCLECLAFAQVASAVPGHPLVTPESDSITIAIGRSGGLAERAVTVVFLARAPPRLV